MYFGVRANISLSTLSSRFQFGVAVDGIRYNFTLGVEDIERKSYLGDAFALSVNIVAGRGGDRPPLNREEDLLGLVTFELAAVVA